MVAEPAIKIPAGRTNQMIQNKNPQSSLRPLVLLALLGASHVRAAADPAAESINVSNSLTLPARRFDSARPRPPMPPPNLSRQTARGGYAFAAIMPLWRA